jgi:hypothetical protein
LQLASNDAFIDIVANYTTYSITIEGILTTAVLNPTLILQQQPSFNMSALITIPNKIAEG